MEEIEKREKILAVAGVFLCAALLTISYFVVRIDRDDIGTVRYIYGDKNIASEISQEDVHTIADILNGKFIDVFAIPACGFDENIAIVVDDKTFCIACDDCGEVYYKDHNGYFSLNRQENEAI